MAKKLKTVVNIEKRWEDGMEHHPRSEKLAKLIAKLDYKFGGDSLGLEFGGDGDSGENLLYALDVINDAIDNDEYAALEKLFTR